MVIKINDKSIIFIHIPKTAGTSILSTLLEDNQYKVTGHPIANDYSEHEWINSFTFSVIRNPYDRFISNWMFHTTNYSGKIFEEYNINIKNKSLKEYCSIVKDLFHTRNNWITSHQFLTHSSGKPIDFLIRFENIQEDWNKLCQLINIKKTLIRLNSTPKKYYMHYFNSETKKFVENLYYEDFKNYQYLLD
jgi:hypothetical protein